MKRQRVQVFYSGRVQGVGFRYTTKNVATGYEITGTVRNLSDGRVEMVAEGEKAEIGQFLQGIRDSEVGGLIRLEQMTWSDGTGEFRGFEITR
jgi:acylphosphatase